MLTFVIIMVIIVVLSGVVLVAVAEREGKLDGMLDDRMRSSDPPRTSSDASEHSWDTAA